MNHVPAVQAIYEAFGRGDVSTILGHLAEDIAWDQDAPGYGIPIYEPGIGTQHVKRFFDALQGVEFLRFEPTNFLSGGSQVAVPIQVKVKIKSTGKIVDAVEVHLWTFNNSGKVNRFFHCVDRHAFVLAYDTSD
jgi:uncharacterized protein